MDTVLPVHQFKILGRSGIAVNANYFIPRIGCFRVQSICMWIRRKVQSGTKTGQKIGYPTLNFHVGNFNRPSGVYACEILIAGKSYKGALYFGPRLSHQGNVLEMHVVGFNKKIYGWFVRFRVGKKIRSTKPFNDLDDLKNQIRKDLISIKN